MYDSEEIDFFLLEPADFPVVPQYFKPVSIGSMYPHRISLPYLNCSYIVISRKQHQ